MAIGVRLDPARPGTGLGLSATRDLLHFYDATLRMAKAAEGGLLGGRQSRLAPAGKSHRARSAMDRAMARQLYYRGIGIRAPPTSGAGRTPVKVVRNPFQTHRTENRAACRERLLRELDCPAHTTVVGFFGALTARKRPLLFVEAIARLHERRSSEPIVGLLFGEAHNGFDAAVDQQAAALGISRCIRRMGFRYPAAPLLAGCDILAVPVYGEPFGRTLVEAMLLGTRLSPRARAAIRKRSSMA